LSINVTNKLRRHQVVSWYSVQYTVYSIQCAVYSVQYTVNSEQCTVYSTQCTVYSVQYTVNSVQCTVYSVQYTAVKLVVMSCGLLYSMDCAYENGAARLRSVSKKFGEWYQKTNKTEYTNKLT
jgi:hypothetical protein